MKVYLFNPETGVFLGEDFADPDFSRECFEMPPDATTIAPPPFSVDQLVVFNAAEQRWEISARQRKQRH